MLKLIAKLLDSRLVLGLAIALMAAGTAQGSEVRAVRLGVHADHTRLVLDLSAPTQFTVTDKSADSLVIVKLADAALAPKLQAALAGQGLVRAIDLEPHGKALEIRVTLGAGGWPAEIRYAGGRGIEPGARIHGHRPEGRRSFGRAATGGR